MTTGPHISIKAEPLFNIAGFHITNSLFSSIIVTILFLLLALNYSAELKKERKNGLFYFTNFLLLQIYNLFNSVVGSKISVFFPWLGAFFLYILFENWFGLLPGAGSILLRVKEAEGFAYAPLFRANTADLNTTLVLGIVAIILVQYYGIKYVGFTGYIKKYINFSGPMAFVLGILEIVSEISRIISFCFRLYGNIFAGEVLLVIISFLVPVLASFPFLMMEIFVGLIQALVFSMLTSVFFDLATVKHH